MNGESSAARASRSINSPLSGLGAQLRLAGTFLTILPLAPAHADNATVAASFRWFPLIGFALGAALGFEDRLLSALFPPALAAVLVILTMVVITGAVHLDALGDTADAIGAGRDRERALSILRDSRVGSFGAAAIFFSLALKTIALASMPEPRRFVALFVALGLARWAMVAVAGGLEYLRAQGGAGAGLLRRDSSSLAVASAIASVALLVTVSPRAIGAGVVAVLLTLAARRIYRKWLGGVTGDLIGACGEIIEITVLILFASS